MAHQNTRSEKIKFGEHNRKAGVAKFKRNLKNRKHRRWDNKLHREWVSERDIELDKSISATRRNRNNSRQGAQMPMSDTL